MRASSPDFKAGDRVVYPNQGVCRITGVQEKEISGQRLTFVAMSKEEDGATVMVPKGKVEIIGIRKVANENEVKKVFAFLAEPAGGPELDWKVRHRAHGEKLATGDLRGVADIVRGLHALSELRPLPNKERETYDNARHLLVGEIAVALAISEVTAEDAVDLALLPPGVERKKPVLKVAQPPDGDDAAIADDLDTSLDEWCAEVVEEDVPKAKPAHGPKPKAPKAAKKAKKQPAPSPSPRLTAAKKAASRRTPER